MLATAGPIGPQASAKIGLNPQVRVLVRELLGPAPRAAPTDRPLVEVDDLERERPAVLDREPRRLRARRAPEGVGLAEAAEAPAIRHKGDTLSSTR